jgi:hypothetical protein
MESAFKEKFIERSEDFIFKDVYRTLTRKNGSEIITCLDNRIILTNLNANLNDESATIELVTDIPFEPIEMIMNKCEQLVCIYDQEHIWAFSLNNEGSNINFSVTYKLDISLAKNEKVLQTIFNNVSRYQSELVVLTTNEIRAYSLNVSLDVPLLRYDFKKEYESNSITNNFDFDFDSSIVDPVSICFASANFQSNSKSNIHNNPQDDITLFLLTSDASIYKIYPFFPYELSVSKEWLTDLFDSTTLLFKSSDDDSEQVKLLSSVKISAILSQSKNPQNINIKKELPSIYQNGKITGPLIIDTFSEDLYAFNAIKLLSLPNDIVAIVFDHAIVLFNRNSSYRMIFQNQDFTPDDNLLSLDTIIFDTKQGSVLTAFPHPVTQTSIFVITSNDSLIQIDFSKWMDVLSNGIDTGDLSEFSKLCQSEKLPTEVFALLKMHLPDEKENDSDVVYKTHENNVFFAWNTREVYAMVLKSGDPDILSTILVRSAVDNDEDFDTDSNDSNDTSSAKTEAQYELLLVGEYKNEVFPQVKLALSKISEINNAMVKFPTTVLNEEKTTTTDLKTVHSLTELASSGQLILFRVLSLLSRRLKMMTMEYHNQINTYHCVMLKKEKIISDFFKLKTAFFEASKRQEKIMTKMSKIMADTELLESKSNTKSISISYQENAYFKELARIRDFVVRKETELEQLNNLVNNVKSLELSFLLKNKEEVLKDFSSRKSLESLKQNLEVQSTFIGHLTERLNELNLA